MIYETQEHKLSERVSIESHVYEDGYVRVSLIDELGLEIASLDGQAREDNCDNLIAALRHHLIAQYGDTE